MYEDCKIDELRLLTTKQVIDLTSLSRTAIWRLEREGDFPRAIQIMPHRKAYRETEVRAWIRKKIEESC